VDRYLKRRLEERFAEQLVGPIRQRHDETEMRIGAFSDLSGSQLGASKSIPLDGPADPGSHIDLWRRRIRRR
jgi:hypothetical protein